MSRVRTLLAGTSGAAALAAVAIVLALFRGCFDHGTFEVVATSRSSRGRVAVVARRFDNEAMSGDQYFVLVKDHVPSETELRTAYYGNRVIFRSDGSCLSVRWRDPHTLTVECRGGSIDPSHIAVQLKQLGDVIIKYVNIPLLARRE